MGIHQFTWYGSVTMNETDDSNVQELISATDKRNIDDHHHHDENNSDASSVPIQEDDVVDSSTPPSHGEIRRFMEAEKTLWNFIFMAMLFSANHGCTVACLGLATSRFGVSIGAWQSSALYFTYTASAILGATYVVKALGGRDALIMGMALYCAYVGCFWVATINASIETPAALLGAFIGGAGGGLLWTAQGSYFTKAAEIHAQQKPRQHVDDSTSLFAGIFAFIYLTEEVILRSLSTALISYGMRWSAVFGTYTAVAVTSALGMLGIRNYHKEEDPNNNEETSTEDRRSLIWHKATATIRLLRQDAKMKYMIGLNAVFGFASAFLTSYVNGNVVRVALDDEESKYVGILAALTSAVAAICSLIFGFASQRIGKGPVLVLGAIAFGAEACLFILVPDISKHWGWGLLATVYILHGIGRSTFEGALRAIFGDYFSYEKEGAFGNIILQNGFATTIGYFLTFLLTCSPDTGSSNAYCVEYKDGSFHNVLLFELIVVLSSLLAILGYWRASVLFQKEQQQQESSSQLESDDGHTELLENENGVVA
jgi:hypothetical protein